MTMARRKEIAAGEFKARCLALLDEVAATGREIVVTKRGRAVARVAPLAPSDRQPLTGSVIDGEDIVEPLDVHWDANR